jgi:hypothetical protein
MTLEIPSLVPEESKLSLVDSLGSIRNNENYYERNRLQGGRYRIA